jgi:hypothetical protein
MPRVGQVRYYVVEDEREGRVVAWLDNNSGVLGGRWGSIGGRWGGIGGRWGSIGHAILFTLSVYFSHRVAAQQAAARIKLLPNIMRVTKNTALANSPPAHRRCTWRGAQRWARLHT